MDGLLIDSEPLWQEAEIRVFNQVGVPLTHEMTPQTTGLRTDEVVAADFQSLQPQIVKCPAGDFFHRAYRDVVSSSWGNHPVGEGGAPVTVVNTPQSHIPYRLVVVVVVDDGPAYASLASPPLVTFLNPLQDLVFTLQGSPLPMPDVWVSERGHYRGGILIAPRS